MGGKQGVKQMMSANTKPKRNDTQAVIVSLSSFAVECLQNMLLVAVSVPLLVYFDLFQVPETGKWEMMINFHASDDSFRSQVDFCPAVEHKIGVNFAARSHRVSINSFSLSVCLQKLQEKMKVIRFAWFEKEGELWMMDPTSGEYIWKNEVISPGSFSEVVADDPLRLSPFVFYLQNHLASSFLYAELHNILTTCAPIGDVLEVRSVKGQFHFLCTSDIGSVELSVHRQVVLEPCAAQKLSQQPLPGGPQASACRLTDDFALQVNVAVVRSFVLLLKNALVITLGHIPEGLLGGVVEGSSCRMRFVAAGKCVSKLPTHIGSS